MSYGVYWWLVRFEFLDFGLTVENVPCFHCLLLRENQRFRLIHQRGAEKFFGGRSLNKFGGLRANKFDSFNFYLFYFRCLSILKKNVQKARDKNIECTALTKNDLGG